MVRSLPRRAVLAASAGALAGCRRPSPGHGRPLVLVFGPRHAPTALPLLQQRLSERSRVALELRAVKSVDEALDLLQSGEADGGVLSLFDYLFCRGVFEVEPLVQLVRSDRTTQAGELLVRAGSEVKALPALAGRKVGYVDPFSVTGYLLAAALLGEAKVKVEPVFLGSHDAVLAAIGSGQVDAGASYAGRGATQPGLSVLATTKEVANEPFFVQPRLGRDVRGALEAALLEEHDATALGGIGDATAFQPVAPGTYESALASLEAAGLHVEQTIKGGWQRANHFRRPAWSYEP